MLLALTRRVLDDSSEAEEVLQEVFLQVWNEAGRYNPDRYSVSTWLVLITRRRAIDRLRSRCGGERAVTAAQREVPVKSTSREVMGTVFMLARRARVVRELKALPPEQRQALELTFYEGLTPREISERMEVSAGTAKTQMLLAMRKLRKALASDNEGPL
jgi:RNA polymerase sigma-70 factor (ECF subfamily)